VDDTLPSIFSSNSAIGYYIAQRAGIGINAGRVRAINSKIRGGEVAHTGVVPFLKVYEATVRSCTQNGVRGGSATTHFPLWHYEIEDILVLKNNKGTDDNRVRKLDYSIQLNKLMYERLLSGGDITLFSPHDVPGLYEAFYSGDNDKFKELYEQYERKTSIRKKKIDAHELFSSVLKERAETGRIYIMNVDHCNTHSSFKDPVYMSNLCQEITLPTKPIQHIDDENGEIALCILSAINVGALTLNKENSELEELCELSVRALEEIIEYQGYPVKAAELSTKARRSLGIGYIGLAHYLAKHKVKYSDKEAWKLVHDLTESFQYYLLKASNKLAEEKGACEYFNRTKYSDGIMPIDTYKQEVDEIVGKKLNHDWKGLRASIKQHGLRHSTLSAQMPSESSSVVSNATNGIEPPRGYLSVKKSKKGPLKQIVPGYNQLKNFYTLLWDMQGNEGYINIVAVMQKFFDQAISGNWSYNPLQYDNNEVPMSVMMKDMLTTYKMGWKTSYYQNTYDFKGEEDNVQPAGLEETVVDTNTNGATMTNGTNGHVNGVNGHSNGETETIADDSEHCDACAI
jgi:ribonucleoside-diphosphate reductase alpha chain